MDSVYSKRFRANVWKLYVFSAFLKRPYLPLIAVYAVTIARLTLAQLGFVVALSALVSLVLELPGGYIADKLGHKKSLTFSAFIIALAPLFFVFMPDFIGIALGVGVFFAGVAFYSGINQAFMHESLIELGEEDKFAKMQARSTGIGLLGNMVLVALVPLTYIWDVRIPFIISSLIAFFVFFLSFTLVTPIKTKRDVSELAHVSFPSLLRNIRSNGMLPLFFMLGLVATIYDKVPTFREVYFYTLGMPVQYLGFILAFGSLIGAGLSILIPRLSKWREDRFYIFDMLLSVGLIVLVGLTHNVFLGIVWFTCLTAYDRNRDTVVHNFLLARSPTRELKATYISLLNFSGELQGIWVPLLLGYLVGKLGLNNGYLGFGLVMAVPALALFVFYRYRRNHQRETIAK